MVHRKYGRMVPPELAAFAVSRLSIDAKSAHRLQGWRCSGLGPPAIPSWSRSQYPLLPAILS
jgi:hypothetical protein